MRQFLALLLLIPFFANAQHSLVGYWHNWNDANAPYIQLDQVDPRYTIIEVSFAVPTSNTDMTMTFVPDGTTQTALIQKIQTLKAQGKKVLISIGGATCVIDLSTPQSKTAFITSMSSILDGFDGIDIDIEHGSSIMASGTIAAPGSAAVTNLIDAVKQIMSAYRTAFNRKMMLTMAPETAYVQGGQSAFGGIWGGYLPIIHALRDSLDILQVQLYNSGTMYGLDGAVYTQGTADFIVAMTEAVIKGFNTTGGTFAGIPANKVAVGLPACASAAGGGYTSPAVVKAAVDYLRGTGPKPGSYTLQNPVGYPDLKGLMTWSINWDAVASCGPVYEYAGVYQTIFGGIPTSASELADASTSLIAWPNPAKDRITVTLAPQELQTGQALTVYNCTGALVYNEPMPTQQTAIDISKWESGLYFIRIGNRIQKIIRE